ncbi:MAG: PorT family protein [Bacteroidales bacterium]|nr:PorT family protein [Bacteroidales bacterium]
MNGKTKPAVRGNVTFVTFFILSLLFADDVFSQARTRFGIHFDPSVCWFSSDISSVENDGVRPGFTFGLAINRFFAPNYAFSTGIGIESAGGKLKSEFPTELDLTDSGATVMAGEAMVYKIQYVVVPLGIRMQTNQIGYLTFFSDLGLDPKVVIGGKCDLPSLDIEGANAAEEIKPFNLAYHVAAGIEYSAGGTTSLVIGLKFANNFLDITEDINSQPSDRIMHKVLSLNLGINF